MTDEILIQYGSVKALSLPAGKPCDGGACDFASAECLTACYELPERNPRQQRTLAAVRGQTSIMLAVHMKREMDIAGTDHLFWFASGDCPHDQTQKLCDVMTILSDNGYCQNGFTRNKRFWEHSLSLPRCRIARTIEDEDKALASAERGLVAVPDYAAGRTYLHSNRPVYFCGGGFGGGGWGGGPVCGAGFMEDANNWFEADCGQCLKYERGCWA